MALGITIKEKHSVGDLFLVRAEFTGTSSDNIVNWGTTTKSFAPSDFGLNKVYDAILSNDSTYNVSSKMTYDGTVINFYSSAQVDAADNVCVTLFGK